MFERINVENGKTKANADFMNELQDNIEKALKDVGNNMSELIWKNPSPDDDFNPTNLYINTEYNLSDFDEVIIYYKNYIFGRKEETESVIMSERMLLGIADNEINGKLKDFTIYESIGYNLCTRNVKLYGNVVSIDYAVMLGPDSHYQIENSLLIPLYIIGVKNGLKNKIYT